MKRNSIFPLITFLAFFLSAVQPLGIAETTKDKDYILILFDMSYSMTRPMGDISRMEAAKIAFNEILRELPDDTIFALRIFAHKGSKDKSTACGETELLIPFQKDAKEKILEFIQSAKPIGTQTPLVYTLSVALDDFKGIDGTKKIILLSDGEETCVKVRAEGSTLVPTDVGTSTAEVVLNSVEDCRKPVSPGMPGALAAVSEMEDLVSRFKLEDIPVDTIGIGDEVPFTWLGDIAAESGGSFFNGANLEGLKSALRKSIGKAGSLSGVPSKVQPEEQASALVNPVRGRPADPLRLVEDEARGTATSRQVGTASNGVKMIAVPSEQKEGKIVPPPREEMEKPQEREILLTLEIILDSSGSMSEKIGNEVKMDMAKKALNEVLSSINHPAIQLGFRSFGFDTNIDRQNKELSCKNSELLIPFSSENVKTVGKAANKLSPWGFTPIAYSLELAGGDLKPFIENKPTIILISDGKETCGGDPIAVIKRLKEMGIDVKVHVIGFDLDPESRKQLMEIAEAGGGQYYDANNYNSLVNSLNELVSGMKEEVLEEEQSRFVSPIEGGGDINSAVTIKPGRYTMAKNIAKGGEVFFYVPSTKAQRTIIKSEIQSYILVSDREGKIKESDIVPCGVMINVYRPDKKKIKGRGSLLRGEIGQWATTHYMDITGEGFYFTVGDAYKPVQKDIIFEVKMQEAGDIFAGEDAPESPKVGGLEINLSDDLTTHLGLEDSKDTFLINKVFQIDTKLSIQIEFAEPDFRFMVDIYNKNKSRIKRFIKLEDKAVLEIDIPKGTEGVYIQITDNNPSLYNIFSSYKLKCMLE